MTTFENKCLILSEIWIGYRNDEMFEEFITYNDLGLPLAFATTNEIVKGTDVSNAMIEESFDILLTSLNIDDDEYVTLDDVLSKAQM